MTFKVKKISFLLILILFLAGCKHNYTQHKTILEAEQLLFTNPDSAYRLLNSIKNPEKLSKADYAAWCLHYTHAQYKLYIEITSDSILQIALNYYDNSNLSEYMGVAEYLNGCISELHNDTKKAMSEYKKADYNLRETNNDSMKGLINYQIGYLFLRDEYFSESERYIDKSIELFKKSNNKKYQYYCYRTKAELIYLQGKSINDILTIVDIGERLSLQESDTAFYLNILIFKGKVLLESNPNLSKEYLLKCFESLPKEREYISALLSYAYSKTNMPDSARFYNRFFSMNNYDRNSLLLKKITDAYVANGERNMDSAFILLENAYDLREKIYKENIKEQLVRIDKQYDLSKKEAEKAKLEIQNQKNILLIAFLSIVVLAVLLILLIIVNLNKKRQAALVIEKQQLEFEVKTKQVENDKKLKILHANLQNKIDNTLQFKKIQTNLSKTERKDEFIADITRQSVLTNVEWQFYIYEANELFEGKILKMREEYPQLTDADMNVIALICLGIDIGNSIVLLDYSNSNTMYMRRMRIKNHLGLDKSTDLELWIKDKIVVDK